MFTVCVLCCSSSAISAASSKKVHRNTHKTGRKDSGGHLPMELETNRQAGLNSKQPSSKSRSRYRLRSWTEAPRHCWLTQPLLPRSSVSNYLSGLDSRISSAFHSTLLCLTRSVFAHVFYSDGDACGSF